MGKRGIRAVAVSFLIATAAFLAGCSTQIRATPEETKDYPIEIQEAIVKGEIMEGMTPGQVRLVLGSPSQVQNFEPRNGKTREEWIYSSGMGVLKTRLLFVDGKLVFVYSSEPGRIKYHQ